MQVCTITPGFNSHGGVPYVARNLVAELASRDNRCLVITDDERNEGVSPPLPDSVEVRELSTPDLTFPLDVLGFSVRALPVLNAADVDLFHAHGHYTVAPILADLLGRLDAPTLVTAHGTYANEFKAFSQYPSFEGKWRYGMGVRIDHEILKRGVNRADRVHAVSEETGQEVIEMGVDPGQVDVVPNGVNLAEFDTAPGTVYVRDTYDIGSAPLAVSVGSIVPRKGVHTLVDVAAAFRQRGIDGRIVHVGGVGHDGYAKKVSEAIDEQGLNGRLTLTGQVDRDELLSWFGAADVVVSASFSEGCPISLLEAAASENTIVATDVGGARDVLGDLGIYVEPGNTEDISSGIRQGFESQQGPAIRERVEERFTWDRIVDDIEQVYQRCLR